MTARPALRRAGLAGLALSLLTLAGPRAAQAGLDRSLERMMGKQAQAAIEAEYRTLSDPMLLGYVQRLGDQVVKGAGSKDKFTFKIIETEQVNAMALPHGTVYVTTGLLRFVDTPDQLAGVIGHEIGHVTSHHSLSSLKKQFWAGFGLGVLGLPSTVDTLGRVAGTLALLRYSRKDEGEADSLAVKFALQGGYDPGAVPEFFRKLAAKDKDKPSSLEIYLSTHPPTDRRLSRTAEHDLLAPGNASARLLVGDGYLRRHLDYQAILAYRQAAAAAPQLSAPWVAIARAYLDAGRPDQAAPAAGRALALSPQDQLAAGLHSQAQALAAPAPAPELVSAPPAPAARLRAARELRLRSSQSLGQRQQDLEQQQAELAKKIKAAARALARAGAPADSAGSRVLQDAAAALQTLDTATDRLQLVAKEAAVGAAAEADFATKLEQLLAQPQPAPQLASLSRWADQYVRDLSEGQESSGRALSLALEAAAAGQEAGVVLEQALSALQLGASSWRGTFITPGTALGQVAQARTLAGRTAQLTSDARRAQAAGTLRRQAWELNLAALPLNARELASLDALVADSFHLAPPAAAAARLAEGGLGWGILSLAGAPGGELAPPASPSPAPAPDRTRPAPPALSREEPVVLLVGLLHHQVERELAARSQLQEAVTPASQ